MCAIPGKRKLRFFVEVEIETLDSVLCNTLALVEKWWTNRGNESACLLEENEGGDDWWALGNANVPAYLSHSGQKISCGFGGITGWKTTASSMFR